MDVEFTFDPFAEMIVTSDLIKNQDASWNGQGSEGRAALQPHRLQLVRLRLQIRDEVLNDVAVLPDNCMQQEVGRRRHVLSETRVGSLAVNKYFLAEAVHRRRA